MKAFPILSLLLASALATNAWAGTFADNFDRPDSATVGNGWSPTTSNVNGNLAIRSNRLAVTVADGKAGVTRTFPLSAATTLHAIVTETNGFGGLGRRYDVAFRFNADGQLEHGYGLRFSRADENFSDSAVRLYDGATEIQRLDSSFQYGPAIQVDAVINPNGSITGTVSQSGASFSFSFGARTIQSTGDKFTYETTFPDSRSSTLVYSTMDDFSLTSSSWEVCGDGRTEGAEACDDGNTASGDCCSSACQFEAQGASCGSDGLPCTVDTCNGAGTCSHGAGNAGTVCRSNGASGASLLSGVASVPSGALAIPVAISKAWFNRLSSPCGSDASGDTSHRIRLYPTGPQNGETVTNANGCAGWHTFTESPASATRLGNILDGLTAGSYLSPSTEAGSTYFNFTGGAIATQFSRMQTLFNTKKNASGEWTVLVPVYEATDCANPSGTIRVIGFTTARIYNVNGTNKTIDANVDCRIVDLGSIPDPLLGGGLNYGTQVASPGYCDIAEYCDGASTTCPTDVLRSAGSSCTDDGNTCTTDLCDGSGSCLHAAGNAGVVCRAATGICDTAETCSGSATSCPADTFSSASVVCRGAAGACDVAEHCTGSSAACPSDSFAAATVECRGAAGVCDVAEDCSGTSADCPADGFVASTTVCRPAAGICDHEETCTGSTTACPVDSFLPGTTACRPAAGVCDVGESCTGSAADCPTDGFASAATVCRASAGVCDTAENCPGTSGECPADAFAASTTTCRSAAGICDMAESCSGNSANCPNDQFVSNSTVCRSAAGTCDVAEHCSGATATCPVDDFASAATVCRSAAGVCDAAENCTGTAAACPANVFVGAGTVCRASAGACDVAESCSGSTAACPTDGFASAATVCRSAAGICDTAENCTGTTAACPGDGFVGTATTCRSAVGVCDIAEHCSGTASACPADGFASAATICRASAGVCDVAESCTGSTGACPADGFASAATVCRSSAGICDAAENCTGTAAACPANAFAGASTVCRASAGICDLAENCSGAAAACPGDGFASAATTCRASAGVCDIAEKCSGSAAACPTDGFAGTAILCRASAGVCDVPENCSGTAAACPGDSRLGPATTCRPAAGECDLAEACDGLGTSCPANAFADTETACSSDEERCTDDLCDGAGACAHPPIPLAPACHWAVVGGSDATTCAVRTRGESEIGGGVCADSADIGDSSSLSATGDWALLEDSSTAARVRPQASILDGSVATGGGCISGLRGSPIFGTTTQTICCDDGDVPLPGGNANNVINACGLHPAIDRCSQDKAQVPADVALLDSLPSTQDLGTILIDVGLSQTLLLGGGLNVVDVNKLSINDGGTLRIDAQGDPEAVLVLRMGHGLKTRIGARIELAGQAQPSRVLFYASKGGCLIGWQNQGAGTIFCPEGKVRMMVQSSWTGAIAGGSAIDIGWGVHLTHEPFLGLAR